MNQFVPLTDELLYEHPEAITSACIPYSRDYPCHRWLGDAGASAAEKDKGEGHDAN